jgi:hypothetical protein
MSEAGSGAVVTVVVVGLAMIAVAALLAFLTLQRRRRGLAMALAPGAAPLVSPRATSQPSPAAAPQLSARAAPELEPPKTVEPPIPPAAEPPIAPAAERPMPAPAAEPAALALDGMITGFVPPNLLSGHLAPPDGKPLDVVAMLDGNEIGVARLARQPDDRGANIHLALRNAVGPGDLERMAIIARRGAVILGRVPIAAELLVALQTREEPPLLEPAPSELLGWLDRFEAPATLVGWAALSGSDQRIEIEIWRGGLLLGQAVAQLYRDDLRGIGDGHHGFRVELKDALDNTDLAGLTAHGRLRGREIGVLHKGPAILGMQAQTEAAKLLGWVDWWHGPNQIGGWATLTGSPLRVVVKVLLEGREIGHDVALNYRRDLLVEGDGFHGFRMALSENLGRADLARLEVLAYADERLLGRLALTGSLV